jgi:uncharacterized CHY-type Zn-finger protein
VECNELHQLLQTEWRKDKRLSSAIAAHIRSCPRCRRGLVRLAYDLKVDDPLGCEQCRSRFPDYYEATQPEYPLVQMPDNEIAQVAYHLRHCFACHEEYEVLVLLSELEESDSPLA